MNEPDKYHVIRSIEGGWAVKRSSASKVSGLYKTQSKALSVARKMSNNIGGELYVHGKDGKIQAIEVMEKVHFKSKRK